MSGTGAEVAEQLDNAVRPRAVGLAILLARYTRRSDVIVAIPVAVRTRSELDPVLGAFINTALIRVDVADEPTAGEVDAAGSASPPPRR